MTTLFIKIYDYLKYHRAVLWLSMVFLFIVTGFFATRIHLEEDLNKLMPSSKNEDGTIKMAFADLRIKDKTFLLFEARDAAKSHDEKMLSTLTTVCDDFVNTLLSQDNAKDSTQRVIGDIFYNIPEDLMFDGIAFLTEHLPAYIDTTAYTAFDTLLTKEHITVQMR